MVPFQQFIFERIHKAAADPIKHNPTDPGWDIALVALENESEKNNPRKRYTTGLKLRPPEGYFFDLIPRENLERKGYEMQKRTIVTRSMTDVITVTLYKFDDDADPLKIPGRWIHAILIPYIWAQPQKGLIARVSREEPREERPVTIAIPSVKYAGDSEEE